MVSGRVIFAVVVVVAMASFVVEAGYRKPPLNGSIFGKRSSAETDYEAISRALTLMCEVTTETCRDWLLNQNSK